MLQAKIKLPARPPDGQHLLRTAVCAHHHTTYQEKMTARKEWRWNSRKQYIRQNHHHKSLETKPSCEKAFSYLFVGAYERIYRKRFDMTICKTYRNVQRPMLSFRNEEMILVCIRSSFCIQFSYAKLGHFNSERFTV